MRCLLTNTAGKRDLKIFLTEASWARCRSTACRKKMIVNMCEINRKKKNFQSPVCKFKMQLLQSYSRVECSAKCVMVDVGEFIKLVCSCAICMQYVCFSRDTVWDTEEMLLHGVSGTSTSLNHGWNTWLPISKHVSYAITKVMYLTIFAKVNGNLVPRTHCLVLETVLATLGTREKCLFLSCS